MGMMEKYIPPEYGYTGFHCPHCGTYAQQHWYLASFTTILPGRMMEYEGVVVGFEMSLCAHCSETAVWYQTRLVFPTNSIAPRPSTDMPQDVAADFNEAREVLAQSPRSSAALLRLAIQKLCKHLGQPGENINRDIGALVKAGLPPQIQQALDIVRVIGNNAVHPGEIDLHDDQETALTLFRLVNLIVEDRITRPRVIDEMYNNLPAGALQGIAQRDKTP